MLKVGIDIGGTKIAGGVVDDDGNIVEKLRVDTPVDTRALADAVVDMARHFGAAYDVAAVGVAAAGFIDRDRATVIHAPNIAWRNEPLKATLESRIDVPVIIENDANAAGWAEFRFGAGRDVEHMVMLTMGTGVGGAVVIGGELFRGGHGIGAELGHIRFTRDGLPCGCGQNGCLEQYASGRALQREANAIADGGGIGAALAALRAEKGSISGPAVSRLVLAGDPGAVEALRRVATALGEACGGFQAVLDPELFVIGGGVAQLGEDLLGPVRIAYETSLPGYGDRPDRVVRDRPARQRRRPDRRRRPRDRGGVADVLLADEVRGDRTDLESDLPPMDRRPPERPRRGRRHPREQPPLVRRLDLPAADDRPARVVPREERLLHRQGAQGLGDADLHEGDRAAAHRSLRRQGVRGIPQHGSAGAGTR